MPKTPYARNMARLSAKIFNEAAPLGIEDKNITKVVRQLTKNPYELDRKFIKYYPPFKEMTLLSRYLRLLGLYRDEHLDFKEEFIRLNILRGKEKKRSSREKKNWFFFLDSFRIL